MNNKDVYKKVVRIKNILHFLIDLGEYNALEIAERLIKSDDKNEMIAVLRCTRVFIDDYETDLYTIYKYGINSIAQINMPSTKEVLEYYECYMNSRTWFVVGRNIFNYIAYELVSRAMWDGMCQSSYDIVYRSNSKFDAEDYLTSLNRRVCIFRILDTGKLVRSMYLDPDTKNMTQQPCLYKRIY